MDGDVLIYSDLLLLLLVCLFRISLPALKEIPQYALKNHVYVVPDHVAIYPVSYHLPKTECYMRRDVLR